MKLTSTLFSLAIACVFITSCSSKGDNKKQHIHIDSLEDVIANLEPETKTYEFEHNEDITITSEKGTVTYVPANAFEFEDGTAVSGNVSLEIIECYSIADMITKNLSTTSGSNILETGGMVYYNATSGGEQLHIKEGMAIAVGFPKMDQTEEMDLFYNFTINDTITTWIPDYDIPEAEAWVKAMQDTIQSESEEALEVDYPIELTDDLYDYSFYASSLTGSFINFLLTGENRTILEYMEDPETVAGSIAKEIYDSNWNVCYDFNINENGKMINFQVRDDGDANYNDYALKVVKEYLQNAPAFDSERSTEEIDHERKYHLGISAMKQLNNGRYKTKFREQYSYIQNQLNSSDLDLFVFAVTDLGWINCDRFLDIEDELKINYTVKVDDPENTSVSIVFKEMNSLMRGTYEDGAVVFYNVPIDREITIIGIGFADDNPTISIAETSISTDEFELTSFTPCTLEELEENLNRIQ